MTIFHGFGSHQPATPLNFGTDACYFQPFFMYSEKSFPNKITETPLFWCPKMNESFTFLYCSSGLALRGAGHSGRAAPALWDSLMPARKGPAHGDAPNMSTGWWYTYPSEKYES